LVPNAEEVFHNARQIADLEARRAFLDSACGTEAQFRARVEKLLDADAAAGQFLMSDGDETPDMCPERPGQQIGRYKLLQVIGEGGFGRVFLAEQTEDVRRRVALKIIKFGMDTRQVVARFEAERQALAMMAHPNIAGVLDAGATPSGRPYFVMEYVVGDAITEFSDSHRLDVRSRLDLFAQVCQAVQHAHTKGILHRDLKPGNILVSMVDGKPSAKVIDFGIAKAVTASMDALTAKTLFTEHRQLVGTPEYMSPEQAEGLADIDTRADVYALGVLLYELITGVLPFDGAKLRAAAWGEFQRIIREEEPLAPSAMVSKSVERTAAVAAARETQPERLGLLIKGDLDWIVLKAMDKDRDRRYESPNQLAADIERHLRGEPVVAGPASAAYRLQKFVRRNKVPVLAIGAIAATLVLATGVSVWFGLSALSARQGEKNQRIAAEAAKALASDAATRAQATLDFIVEALQQSDPTSGGSQGVTVEAAMDRVVQRLDGGLFAREPEKEAAIRSIVGRVQHSNGRLLDAERQASAALSIREKLANGDSADLAQCLNDLASVLQDRGRLDEAESMYARALEMRRRLFPKGDLSVAVSLGNVGSLAQAMGRPQEAVRSFRDALSMLRALGGADADVAVLLNNIGLALDEQGNKEEAERYLLESVALRRTFLKPGHPDLAQSLNNLGMYKVNSGKLDEGDALFREALEGYKVAFKGDHPLVAMAMNNLAGTRDELGHVDEAIGLYTQAIEMRRRLFPGDHDHLVVSMGNLASVLNKNGQAVAAEALYLEALAMRRRLFPGDHAGVALSLNNLARAQLNLGRLADAESSANEAVQMMARLAPDGSARRAVIVSTLALVASAKGEIDRAESLATEAEAMVAATDNPPGPATNRVHEVTKRVREARTDLK